MKPLHQRANIAVFGLFALSVLLLGASGTTPAVHRVTSVEGRELTLVSREHPTALLFVDSECPISNRYAPVMQRLQQRFGGSVDFRYIYPNGALSDEAIRAHQRAYSLSGVAIADRSHALVELAGIRVTPAAAVFDRSARLVYRGRIDNRFVSFGQQRAEATQHDVAHVLSALLSEKGLGADSATPASVIDRPGVGCFVAELK